MSFVLDLRFPFEAFGETKGDPLINTGNPTPCDLSTTLSYWRTSEW